MIDFKKIIRAELKKQDMSVPVLAHKVECNYQTIYNYLNGKSTSNADLLEDILNVLGGELSFKK